MHVSVLVQVSTDVLVLLEALSDATIRAITLTCRCRIRSSLDYAGLRSEVIERTIRMIRVLSTSCGGLLDRSQIGTRPSVGAGPFILSPARVPRIACLPTCIFGSLLHSVHEIGGEARLIGFPRST